jgi:ATP-binding cassette subfamily C protein
LPDGIYTNIGSDGLKLSGGQMQRLAIARVIIRDPKVIILDEATSSLDSENEQRIQQAIDRLRGSMTILMIAHRLSTIRGAEMIHVLESGRLVESGDWDTLLSRPGGRFRQLFDAQTARPSVPSAGLLRV